MAYDGLGNQSIPSRIPSLYLYPPEMHALYAQQVIANAHANFIPVPANFIPVPAANKVTWISPHYINAMLDIEIGLFKREG